MSHDPAEPGASSTTAPRELSRRQVLGYAFWVGVAASGPRLARATLQSSSPDSVMIEAFGPDGRSKGDVTVTRVVKTDTEWRQQLSLLAYTVTRHEGTEPAFSGALDKNHGDGLYSCVCCGTVLFDSRAKFDSGTGWPSFWRPISKLNVIERSDDSYGMHRIAVACKRCDAHLGHVFDDGPKPTGLRYCMNSVALTFAART